MSFKKFIAATLFALVTLTSQAAIVTIDTEDLRVSEVFSQHGREEAVSESITNCQRVGGKVLKTKVWAPGEIEVAPEYWQAASICLLNKNTSIASVVTNDPNKLFCHIRSTPNKCGEIGSCEWIAPKTSFCGVRAGFENDPNAKFCHIRSTAQKCGEIGVCEFQPAAKIGHCQARQ